MSERYDLKALSIENPPCARCRLARRREEEAYARGVRDEHRRHEALRDLEAYDHLVAVMRDRRRRDRATLRAVALVALLGALALALLLEGVR